MSSGSICVVAAAHLSNGDRDAAAPLALAARAIAQRHSFPYWLAWSAILLAAVDTELAPTAHVAALHDAITGYEAIGARQALPFAYGLLAERLQAYGRTDDARRALDIGLGHARSSGISVFTPRLLAQHSQPAVRLC